MNVINKSLDKDVRLPLLIGALNVFGVYYLVKGQVVLAIMGVVVGIMATLSLMSIAYSLITSFVCLVYASTMVFQAARGEMSGATTYEKLLRRSTTVISVTRAESPAKFREALNLKWEFSAFFVIASVGCFKLARKFDEWENSY